MKKLLILLAIFISTTAIFAETHYVTTSMPYYHNEITPYELNKIAEIENKIYGKNFNSQHVIARIEQLERDVFNRTYPNSTIDQRINNLIYACKRNAQVVKDNNSKMNFKNILNGIGSAFLGVPTGYTPPIYSDTDAYSTPYYSVGSNGIGQHWGQYSDYYGSNGWRRHNHAYGGNSGVRIID